MNNHKTALVIADLKNENLGDRIIFESLSKKLLETGFSEVCKLSNQTSINGKIRFINIKNTYAVLLAIKSANRIYIGGGGIFQDDTSQTNLIYFFAMVLLCSLFDKQIEISSIGITTLRTKLSEKIVTYICKHSQIISVRDQESKAILEKYTSKIIQVQKDHAFNFDFDLRTISPQVSFLVKRSYILLSVRPVNMLQQSKGQDYINENLLMSHIANTVNLFCNSNKCLAVWVPFDPQKDIPFINRITTLLNCEFKVIEKVTPNEFYNLTKEAKISICMRLHAAILSHISRSNFIAIQYNDKISHFMNSINSQDRCIKMNDLDKLHSLILNKLTLA